ncbi:RING1 and YY1-binding protein A-like [Lytechinus variegatus]|uniref:RING1 and YY1-binding protein A-like n=1 Tax=Lytechinus variegatus TaxID=7654 RepID=UPI001BB1F25D|nr:RING1 and YY1-binding protein A-like [Lytechinus variegatus]
MEGKRSSSGRQKRVSRSPEANYWDCSVCTYRNRSEAFKCEMCDVRKGTSTRKPRLNAQVVAQQRAQQFMAPGTGLHQPKHLRKQGLNQRKNRPRLKNVDRSSAISTQVVVNDVSVIITEYRAKAHTRVSPESDDNTSSGDQTTNNINGV